MKNNKKNNNRNSKSANHRNRNSSSLDKNKSILTATTTTSQQQQQQQNIEKIKFQKLLELSMSGELALYNVNNNSNNGNTTNTATNFNTNTLQITNNSRVVNNEVVLLQGNYSSHIQAIINYHVPTTHHYESFIAICEECHYHTASWRCHNCDNQIYCNKCLIVLHSYSSPFAHHVAQFLPYYTTAMHKQFLYYYNEKRMEVKFKKTLLYLQAKFERMKLHAIITIQSR